MCALAQTQCTVCLYIHPVQREHAEMVASMQRLKPTNHFEMSMTDIAFPRQFPIDNETANKYELHVHTRIVYVCIGLSAVCILMQR